MATTSFREMWTTFIIVGVLMFSMISFIVISQQNNGVDDTILENSLINKTFSNLGQNLTILENNTQTQRQNFESEIPERGFGSLIIFSIVGITQKFTGLLIGIYNIFIVLPSSILGISPVVTSAISSILIVSLVLLGWRVYRIGS